MISSGRWKEVSAQDFAASWLALKRGAQYGPAIWSASEWVTSAELEWAAERPSELYEAILILLGWELSDWELELLGAGPIESLLASHFRIFSGRLLDLASRDANALRALQYVDPPDEFVGEFDSAIDDLPSNGKE